MLAVDNPHTGEEASSFEPIENLLKAAADRLRLEVLRALNQESYGVQELCTIFNIKQSGMSHHLKVLANAGLVTTRREGNSIFYRRAHQAIQSQLNPLQHSLFNTVDKLKLTESVLLGVKQVQQSRAKSSQEFFAENADKFRAQQDLIASHKHYYDGVKTLLNSVPIPTKKLALEIGPGEGAFLADLSRQFDQVLALDSSAEMLKKAAATVDKQQLSNVTLIHGNAGEGAERNIDADCIVVNMVLHHTPSPADIFQDLATYLRPKGALLVCDLCHHDQAWAKENCGDIWLGFEPEDLTHWASNAGLSAGQDMYLALRNGFRIQIRHFYKSDGL